MMALIKGGDETATAAKIMALDAWRQGIATQPYSDTLLKAPITPLQRNIFSIGKNYVDHVAEVATKMQEPVQMTEYPVVFTKATSSMCSATVVSMMYLHGICNNYMDSGILAKAWMGLGPWAR